MKIQFTFVLFAALLVSCHSTSQTTLQKAPAYTFKKVDIPTVSPCVQCIMTSAKERYRRRRAISFPACVSGSLDKRYLKLSVKNGNEEHKLVISRSCSEGLTVIGIGLCPTSGNCGLSPSGDGWIVSDFPTIYCQGQPILTIEMKSSSVRVVTLASGWDLYYEAVICP